MTAKSTTRKSAAAQPVAVPAAIREPAKSKPTPKKAWGVKGLIGKLAGMGSKTAPKSDKKKKDRPQMVLAPAAQQQFERVAPAVVLAGYLKSYLEVERAELDRHLKEEYLRVFWQHKTQPQNPRLSVLGANGRPKCEGLFSLVAKWHIDPIECEDGESPEEAMARILVDVCEFEPEKAAAFAANELDFTPQIVIPLTELEGGDNPVAQAAAQELMRFLAGEIKKPNLTDEQKASLIQVNAQTKVLSGFLDRLCQYCETPDQVDAVLSTVIRPEWHLKSVDVLKGQEAQRSAFLLNACEEIMEGEEAKKQAGKGGKNGDDDED